MQYREYFDQESGLIKRPASWGNPFGDGVWRSSWFHASMLVIRALAPQHYAALLAEHGVDAAKAGSFLAFFRAHCLGGNNGWAMPKHPEQHFSRDQLVPLLHLLAVVAKFAPEFKGDARAILQDLIRLEEQGRGVSATPQGRVGRNIGYLIDVLCDADRYDLNYRSSDLPLFLVPCFGNIDCAKKKRRSTYKSLFMLALKAYHIGGWAAAEGLDISDEYSIFNALAAVSLQCLAWGKDDADVQAWRSNFAVHADQGWGPAFQLVAGRSVTDAALQAWVNAHVTREQDNDIIAAQRPTKIKDGIISPNLGPGTDRWLLLDHVILQALRLIWR
jgi:hypothetical protein